VDIPDTNLNTPLHYAAKYGNIELCRLLVEKGASVISRNDQRQTPYDVAESHVVRQYLLPLQLQFERQTAQDAYSFAPSAQMYSGAPVYGGTSTPSPGPLPPLPVAAPSSSGSAGPPSAPNSGTAPAVASATPPPIFTPAALNLGRQISSTDSGDSNVTSPITPTGAAGTVSGAPVGPPATSWNVPVPTRQTSGNSRAIQPGKRSSDFLVL
jgi:hypothetical protein